MDKKHRDRYYCPLPCSDTLRCFEVPTLRFDRSLIVPPGEEGIVPLPTLLEGADLVPLEVLVTVVAMSGSIVEELR